jgi:hypothetical protein
MAVKTAVRSGSGMWKPAISAKSQARSVSADLSTYSSSLMAVDRAQAPPFSLNVRTTANRPRRFCAAAERSLSSSEVSTFAAAG